MRTKSFALVALLAIVVCSLSGCFLYKGFSYSGVVEELEGYGLQRLWKTEDINDLKNRLESGSTPSAFYATDDKDEAGALFDSFVSSSGGTRSDVVKKIIIAVEKESYEGEQFTSEVYYIDFQNKKDAESVFYAMHQYNQKSPKSEMGKKFGYQYTLAYGGNYAYVARRGVYLSGSTIVIVHCFHRNGYKWGFTANIYDHLGLVDPKTLDEG